MSPASCFLPLRETPLRPRYERVTGCNASSMRCWTLSRAESGALIPDREDIDLASVTADVVEGYRPATEGRLNLRVDMPTEPLRAYVDRTMWTTIVTNLVNNAVKFTQRRRGCGKPERRRQPGGPHRRRHRRRYSAGRAGSDLREVPSGQQW